MNWLRTTTKVTKALFASVPGVPFKPGEFSSTRITRCLLYGSVWFKGINRQRSQCFELPIYAASGYFPAPPFAFCRSCLSVSLDIISFGPCLAVCLHHSLPGPKRYQRYFLVLGSRIAVVLRWTNHVPGATSLQSGSQTVDKLDNLNQILPSTGDPGFVLFFHVFPIRWSPCICFRLHTLALALTFSSVSQHRLRRNCEASWWHGMRMPLVRLGQSQNRFFLLCPAARAQLSGFSLNMRRENMDSSEDRSVVLSADKTVLSTLRVWRMLRTECSICLKVPQCLDNLNLSGKRLIRRKTRNIEEPSPNPGSEREMCLVDLPSPRPARGLHRRETWSIFLFSSPTWSSDRMNTRSFLFGFQFIVLFKLVCSPTGIHNSVFTSKTVNYKFIWKENTQK